MVTVTTSFQINDFFRYKEAVLRAKMILEDQPLKGLDKAVWWIEYVIRQGDVSHLKSPAASMSFFEYFMIDAVAFLFFILFLMCYIVMKVLIFVKKITKTQKKAKTS